MDEYRRVIITKEFTSEKEPDSYVKPLYVTDTEATYEDLAD